jgi:regulatory protein
MATGSAGGRSRGRSSGRSKSGSAGTPLSLKGRGLALLAQRDHSRVELKRRLMPHARALVLAEEEARAVEAAAAIAEAHAQAAAAAETETETETAAPSAFAPESAPVPSAAERVNEVLDWLHARDYLSDARFAESRTHARSAKFGNLRIRQELSQHGVTLTPESAQRLKDTEFERARELHARKFGRPPADVSEYAKQSRFLAGRGFSADAIRLVMRLVGWASNPGEVADGDED